MLKAIKVSLKLYHFYLIRQKKKKGLFDISDEDEDEFNDLFSNKFTKVSLTLLFTLFIFL